MANNTVVQNPQGITWPLGFISVATPGTPVGIMSLVDPNNNNAPGTPTGRGSGVGEYTPVCHKIWFQACRVGNNNVAITPSTGNVYILMANQNAANGTGPGNRSDTGVVLGILNNQLGFEQIPSMEFEGPTISPYAYAIDADNAGDGVLVTMINCSKG